LDAGDGQGCRRAVGCARPYRCSARV
jgi:hypothetical protein